MSVVGFSAFFDLALSFLPLVSMAMAFASMRRIIRYELAGTLWPRAGLCLSAITLTIALAWHLAHLRAESLPGFIRVDLADLQLRNLVDLDRYANQPICVKGYIDTPLGRGMTRAFQLSPDGDFSNPNSSITVIVECDSLVDSRSPVSVSGILTVNLDAKISA